MKATQIVTCKAKENQRFGLEKEPKSENKKINSGKIEFLGLRK